VEPDFFFFLSFFLFFSSFFFLFSILVAHLKLSTTLSTHTLAMSAAALRIR
jgi:hypothetical protein